LKCFSEPIRNGKECVPSGLSVRQVATVLGSIPASSLTVESEGRQMKQCWLTQKISLYLEIVRDKMLEIHAQRWNCVGEKAKI
jgi:hypothetical protein